jgi:multisubunit Na+/H+ antiporter MnhB subunit
MNKGMNILIYQTVGERQMKNITIGKSDGDEVISHIRSRLSIMGVGLCLAIITVLYGQFMGLTFGLNEDAIKGQLSSSAAAVRETVYKGNDAKITATVDKSWVYMQRAHLHAGSLGTTAIALIAVLTFARIPKRVAFLLSAMLGAGGLGYSIYWMWAGFIAPGLGGTGAAKEALRLLAMPSSGMFVVASVAALVAVVLTIVWPLRAVRDVSSVTELAGSVSK